MASPGTHLVKNLESQYGAETTIASPRGGSRILFRRGCTRLLFYFNTNKPHSFFFVQNTSCIRKPQVISGGEGSGHPLHPPPRSAPESLFKKSTIPKLKMLGPLCKQTVTEDRLQNSVIIYSFYFKAQQR